MNPIDKQKKEDEERALRKALSILGKPIDLLVQREAPDFELQIEARSIGVEVTSFHIKKKEAKGKSRRSIEIQWHNELLELIMDHVNKHKELSHKKGTLYFRNLWLPSRKEQLRFIQQLVALAKVMVHDKIEITDNLRGYPLLDKYLEKVALNEVKSYIRWQWNYDSIAGDLSEMEDSLIESVSEKMNRLYKEKTFEEIWLVIYSEGGWLSQTIMISKDICMSFARFAALANNSRFDKIIISDLAFGIAIEWPSWTIAHEKD